MTRAQLVSVGMTRRAIERRVEAGWLVRLHDGVYAVGHTALTKESRLLAAVYACGPEALASYRAAGRLRDLLRGAQPIEVTAPRGRKPRHGVIVHRSRSIHPDDRDEIDGIPVTSLARTIVDLADVLPEPRLADAVHQAEVQRRFDLNAVDDVLERLPGRKGRHKLRRVLVAYKTVQPFTRSRAERLVLELCEEHGLRKPKTNTWIDTYEVDFYWPEARLVLEFDGAATHHTTRAFHADRARDRALAAKGIQVLRATWPDVDTGKEALAKELVAIHAIRRHR